MSWYGPANGSLAGDRMRRIIATLVLAVCLLGCSGPKADQVPLVTIETPQGMTCCWLFYAVVDVVADPTTGTPTFKDSGLPMRWPRGYTAWRAGSEVKVMDGGGNVVLTTGSRYRIEPLVLAPDQANWVVGSAKPCPDCKLDSGPE